MLFVIVLEVVGDCDWDFSFLVSDNEVGVKSFLKGDVGGIDVGVEYDCVVVFLVWRVNGFDIGCSVEFVDVCVCFD